MDINKRIAHIVAHEILVGHTNKPESVDFLNSEVIEYRSQAEKDAEEHNWNVDDQKYVEEKALKMIKEKMAAKYSDVRYSEKEIAELLDNLIKDLM